MKGGLFNLHPKLEGKTLESIYEADIPLKFETLYLRNISYELCDNSDKKLMLMLLVPKKAVTRKWLKARISHSGWMDWHSSWQIYVMGRLSTSLRIQKDGFNRIKRSTWTESVKPAQSGFCWLCTWTKFYVSFQFLSEISMTSTGCLHRFVVCILFAYILYFL